MYNNSNTCRKHLKSVNVILRQKTINSTELTAMYALDPMKVLAIDRSNWKSKQQQLKLVLSVSHHHKEVLIWNLTPHRALIPTFISNLYMLHIHVWSKWDLKCQSFTKLNSQKIPKLYSFSVPYEQEDSRHVTCAVIISTLHLTCIKHGHIWPRRFNTLHLLPLFE